MSWVEKASASQKWPGLEDLAKAEHASPEHLLEGIAKGTVAYFQNSSAPMRRSPCAVGEGLRTKVNANIGTSKDRPLLEDEIKKLEVAVSAGTDTVMDLSTGGNLDEIHSAIVEASDVPIGTVPIYDAAVVAIESGSSLRDISKNEMLEAVRRHAEMGIDFVTVHCGVNRSAVDQLSKSNRVTQVVSRGGSMLIEWMHHNGKENPYYEHYDELLAILKQHDVTISLGDGLRPGCLADANDRGQIAELVVIGELVERARAEGVQAIVEGPGHVPLDQVRTAVETEKAVCRGAPFYVLGPLVTDVAAGFDHIAAAIGGAVAAWAGADFLCYVTPTEHLGLPDARDVEIGVVALRVAGHAGDIAKGIPHAREWDDSMSEARRKLDWAGMMELSIHSPTARRIRNGSPPTAEEVCTMCSELCAMKTMDEVPWAKKK